MRLSTDERQVTCAHCGHVGSRDSGSDWEMDINADWVCEECADTAVKVSAHESSFDRRFFANAEKRESHGFEEMSTGYYPLKKEAMLRVLELAKVWGKQIIIEKD